MQRRSFPRLRISSNAYVVTREGSFPGTLENISLSGLYVRTGKVVVVGESSEITFPLPAASSSDRVRVKAVAVRVDDAGVAFRISSIDHATFSHLKSILKNKAVRKLAA
jgi:PilZ domain